MSTADTPKDRPFADRYLGRFASRKLFVMVLATVFLALQRLDGEQWAAIAVAYVGVQGFTDAAVAWKRAGKDAIAKLEAQGIDLQGLENKYKEPPGGW